MAIKKMSIPLDPVLFDESTKQNYKKYTYIVECFKNRIEDLESSIDINRKMIRDLIAAKFSDASIETTETTSSFSPKVLETLLIENLKLEVECKKSLQDLSETQVKSFLSQQIANEVEAKLNEIRQDYEEKLNEYSENLKSRDKAAEDLKKSNTKLISTLESHIQSKNLIIVAPTEEILETHVKVEKIKEKIQEVARTCYIASNYRDILSTFNKNTFNSLQKIQALLKNPINRKCASDRLEIVMHDEMSNESVSSSESSEIEISELNRNNTVSNKSSVVPKIDFSKINKKGQNRSIATLQAYPEDEFETSHKIKELKSIYITLNEKITENSGRLEKITQKNFKLQQENIGLWKSICNSKEEMNIRKLIMHKNLSISKYSDLEMIDEEND